MPEIAKKLQFLCTTVLTNRNAALQGRQSRGGRNPPIFRKICVEIIKIRLFGVKFLKVDLF